MRRLWGGKVLMIGLQFPAEGASWMLFVSWCICLDSPSNQTSPCTPTVTSPPPYLPAATTDIIHDPISNETPPLTFGFVFNKSARQPPRIPVAFRKGIYHSAVDQIWHTPSIAGNGGVGYTHTVDLLAWYTGHSKIKYVLRDTSHLSWNCHKPIFTARTSRNWIRENTVTSWPSKQSSALKAGLHSGTQISWTEIIYFYFESSYGPGFLVIKDVLEGKVSLTGWQTSKPWCVPTTTIPL